MGHQVSKETCVDLSDLPLQEYIELIKEPFTVVRTDGRVQDGWQIPAVIDPNRDMQGIWVASHAKKFSIEEMPFDKSKIQKLENGLWKVFMVRKRLQEEEKYVWGWRECPADGPLKFWPTRLTTEEERSTWRKAFREKLDTLEVYEQQSEEKQNALNALQFKKDSVVKEDCCPEYSPEEVEAVIAVLQKERGTA